MRRDRIATISAIVITGLIFIAAFLVHWRENILFVGDRIIAVLELLGGAIGLAFGFALIAVILRVAISVVIGLLSWSYRKLLGPT